jgi:hypothetical protein
MPPAPLARAAECEREQNRAVASGKLSVPYLPQLVLFCAFHAPCFRSCGRKLYDCDVCMHSSWTEHCIRDTACADAASDHAPLSFPPSVCLRFSGRLPGPQFGSGFCWYRTSFTFAAADTDLGCREKSASILATSSVDTRAHLEQAHVDSLASSTRVGDASDTFAKLTGCVLTHARMMSCTCARVAVVFSEPGHACEREIS